MSLKHGSASLKKFSAFITPVINSCGAPGFSSGEAWGLLRAESHAIPEQVRDHKCCNRQPNQSPPLPEKKGIECVAEQVDAKNADSRPIAPMLTVPQSQRSCSARHANHGHQEYGPESHWRGALACVWVQAPEGIEGSAGQEQDKSCNPRGKCAKDEKERRAMPTGRFAAGSCIETSTRSHCNLHLISEMLSPAGIVHRQTSRLLLLKESWNIGGKRESHDHERDGGRCLPQDLQAINSILLNR